MKTKQIIVLAIILVALIAGVIVKQLQKPAELATEEYSTLDLSFDPTQVGKIEIVKGKDQKLAELSKIGGLWSVANFYQTKGDPAKIDNLLNAIRNAKGELRAKNKSLFADFGMAEDKVFRLILSTGQGKTILSLVLGNKKPSYNSLFLRKSDSNLVYFSSGDLFDKVGLHGDPEKESPKPEYWADTSLVDLNVDLVRQIETRRFKDGKEVLTSAVLRESDPTDNTKKKWKYSRPDVPFPLEADKIKTFLSSMKGWRASKAIDPKAKDCGFSKPTWQMKIGLEGNQEVLITAGDQDTETQGYFVQVSNQVIAFVLSNYYFQNFDIDDSKFFADNPLLIDPDKTEKLTIHADTKNLQFAPKEKKWDSLTSYLNDLKTFGMVKLLFDPVDQKKVQTGEKYWLEIQKTGEASVALDVGSVISEQNKSYAARKRDNTQAFAISESVFKKLFENLDRLAEPKQT